METVPYRVPFILHAVGHFYFLQKQLNLQTGAPAAVFLPAMIVSVGCAVDNIRLSIGVTRLGKLLSYLSFFLHVTAVPLLIISITLITQQFSSVSSHSLTWKLISRLSFVLSAVLILDGFHMFLSEVYGNLIEKQTSHSPLPQYGLLKIPQRFLLGVISLSVYLLLCGGLWWYEKGDNSVFFIQLFCFLSQAVTPMLVNKAWLMQTMNLFEVIVIGNIVSLIAAI